MKILELFCGTKSFTKVAEERGHQTFTVDIDSSGFTAFNFPLPAVAPYTPASVTVVGDEHGSSVDQLAVGKMNNQAYIGVVLQPGAALPAGENGDVIKWRAGRSFSIDNE